MATHETFNELREREAELQGRVERCRARGQDSNAYEAELRHVRLAMGRMAPWATDAPAETDDGATGTVDAQAPADDATRPELIRRGNRLLADARGAATDSARIDLINQARRLFDRAGDSGMVRYCDRWIPATPADGATATVDAPAEGGLADLTDDQLGAMVHADVRAAVVAYDPTARLHRDHTADPAGRYIILTDGDVLGAGPTAWAAWCDADRELASLAG